MGQSFNFIFLILILFAEIIGTIGGFGSSVFFVPVANFYFDFETALGLVALFHIASNFSKIALFRKGLDKRLIIYLGIPSLIFVIIGSFLAKYINSHFLEMFLGVFLVGLSLIFLIKKDFKIKDGNPQAIVGGTLSGLFAGLLGTGGAVRGLTMAAFNMEKSVFIATSAVIDMGVDISRTIIYFYNGFIKSDILIYIPFLIVIGWAGTYIGKLILMKIPQEKFKKISLFLILGVGIATIFIALI